MFNRFLDLEQGKVYGINSQSCMKTRIINKVIMDNPYKKIMLWQNDFEYFKCFRMNLHFNDNLDELLDGCIDDFDILIISFFSDWANTREVCNFLGNIKKNSKMKGKSVIIFFKQVRGANETFKIEDFHYMLDAMLENLDEIWVFNRYLGHYKNYEAEEVFTETKRYWQEINYEHDIWAIREIEKDKEDDV